MAPQTLRRLLFTLPGLLLAVAVIVFPRSPEGTTAIPVGPFGFAALATVHLLACWPAADALASIFAPKGRARRPVAIGCLVVAMLLAKATFELPHAADAAYSVDFATAWLSREIWAFLLVYPWCFAARCLFPSERTSESPTARERVVTLLCALLLALALPAGYASHVFRRETKVLEAKLQEGRFLGTRELAARLSAAGSDQPVGEYPVGRVYSDLSRLLEQYREQLSTPLPANAGEEQVVQRAALHAALGEYDAALRLVESQISESVPAGLLKASILDDQQLHDEAASQFRAVIAAARADDSPAAQQALVQAYDGLAETLRDQRRIGEAEAAYDGGIQAVPTAEAHFRFQLGRHYALGGRSEAARAAFTRAAELDPAQYAFDRPLVRQQLRPLEEGTPSCLLPLPRSLTPSAQR